jgi:hypothetical protein
MKNFSWALIFFLWIQKALCFYSNDSWSVENNSKEPASVLCTKEETDKFFFIENLMPNEYYNLRYKANDNIGWPPPDIWFKCTFVSNKKIAHLGFKTINWGDRLNFILTDEHVIAIQRESWGNEIREHKILWQ